MSRFLNRETLSDKAQLGVWLRSLCLFILLLGLGGCTAMISSKPPGPWHEAYEPLDDLESMTFVSNALQMAVEEFGEPVIPVNKVILRRTRKTEWSSNYRISEDFTKTACIDSTNGVFVIYMGEDPRHGNYYALLGHECAHLINPYITDWYMEGIATVFSKEVCEALDKPWGNWTRHFKKSRHDPYALSYRMMTDLKTLFPDEYPKLMNYTRRNPRDPKWLWIDIDSWVNTLPPERRDEALNLIKPYVKRLSKRTTVQYGFTVPLELIEE